MDITFVVDEAEAPLIMLTYPATATEAEIGRLFETFESVCRRLRNIVWVIDMREFNPLTAPPKLRRVFADHYEKSRAVIERSTVAECRVVGSSLTQGVVTAVDWLVGRPYVTKNFTNLELAKNWARDFIAKGSGAAARTMR